MLSAGVRGSGLTGSVRHGQTYPAVSPPRITLAYLAPLLVSFIYSCEPSSTPPAQPAMRAKGAIVVVIDALRRDRLGVYGNRRGPSPNIDALAAEGTRFDTALTPAPWTLPAMASLWTSLYPSMHGALHWTNEALLAKKGKDLRPVSVLGESYVTLAEILRSKGFATAAFIDGAYTGPVFGLSQGFDRIVEDELYGVRLNTEALLQWLSDSRPERFLAYLHVVEVHSPYGEPGVPNELRGRTDPEAKRVLAVLEEERRRFRQIDFDPAYAGSVDGAIATLRRLRAQGQVERRDLDHLLALYDRGIAYADIWIGALVAGLKKLGLYDQVVLVVTADHGEEFFDHGGFEHGDTFYDELLRIPLIIHVPGLGNGRTVDAQVSLLDVTPTLLDLLGVVHQEPLQGLSLRHAMAGEPFPDRVLFAEANQGMRRVAMRTKKLKYMHDAYQAGRPQAFDLESDPTETKNLCQNGTEKCRVFAETIQDWQAEVRAASQGSPSAPPTAAIDERTRERLRALGYDR